MILESTNFDKFEDLIVFIGLEQAENYYKNNIDKSFIFQIPSLPSWTNKLYKCQEHEVNIYNLTCTCDNYKDRSIKYYKRDYRKCCKHLYYKLNTEKIKPFIGPRLLLILKGSSIFNENELYKETFKNKADKEKQIYIGHKQDSEWLSIYAFPEGANHSMKFGYNILTKKWVDNIPPADQDKIVYFINRLFTVQSKIVKNN